jgi:type IV pilus assembly protein PilC
MAIFRYKASDKSGHKKAGQVVGLSESDASARLKKKDLTPISLVNITHTLDMRFLMMIAPIKVKDLAIFTRQFSVMISANVPVVESLVILVDQTENISLKNLISEIGFEVDSGSFLSEAFSKRPKIFSEFFINIVRSGETSGKLDEVLNYLADEMEQNYDMVAKIKGAMIYPIFVTAGLIGVGIVLMIYVIPNLTAILTETNAVLPFSTRVVIGASNFFKNYLWLVGLIIIAIWVAMHFYLKTYFGKRQMDVVKLRMPIFGKLFKYISLSTLLKGGVTITKSLEITADVIGNIIYRELIIETLNAINDGNPVSMVMENSSYIPKMVPQMIAVGERTGKLDSVLDRITTFYSRDTANMLDNLSKLMEPIIMVIMGVGVGIMVAAVIMPMYNMASQF